LIAYDSQSDLLHGFSCQSRDSLPDVHL
jgi:hypothetical protein